MVRLENFQVVLNLMVGPPPIGVSFGEGYQKMRPLILNGLDFFIGGPHYSVLQIAHFGNGVL